MKVRYTEPKTTPLVWHRVNQILFLPVAILLTAFLVYSEVCGLLRLHSFNYLPVTELFPVLSYPVEFCLLSVVLLIQMYLLLKAWILGFRWLKPGLHALLVHYLLLLVTSIWTYVWILTDNMFLWIGLKLQEYMHITVGEKAILVFVSIFTVLIVIYCVLWMGYYLIRRKLYLRLIPEERAEVVTEMVSSTSAPVSLRPVEEKPMVQETVREEESHPHTDPKIRVIHPEETEPMLFCRNCGAKLEYPDQPECPACHTVFSDDEN